MADVGVTLEITLERDAADQKLLTVVHLGNADAQDQLRSIDRKKAASVAARLVG